MMRITLITLLAASIAFFSAGEVSAQQQSYSTGLRFLSPETYSTIPLAVPPSRGLLPTSVDLSSDFPEPKSQGNQGSCVGWAVAYALKSYQERKERGWDLTKEEHQFSPSALYNSIRVGGCDGGSYIPDAFEALLDWGALSLKQFTYDETVCSRLPTTREKRSAVEYRISSVRVVNVQSATELKSHLAADIPIVIGMEVYDNFDSYSGGVYSRVEGSLRGGHAVTVVGYDDSRGAFKIINSWGKSWGENGFAWIAYDTFKRIVREAYVSRDMIGPPVERDKTQTSSNDVTLKDGFEYFDESGFSFGKRMIVPWNSELGDLLFARPAGRQGGEPGALFFPFDAPPYDGAQDKVAQAGVRPMGNIVPTNVKSCPISGYRYHWSDVDVDQTYCVRNRSGDKYYVVRVVDLDPYKVVFEWYVP